MNKIIRPVEHILRSERKDPPQFFLGIDGGGTKCRGRLVDKEKNVLVEMDGGPANVFLDPHGAINRIIELSKLILQKAEIQVSDISTVRMCAGLAGFEISSAAEIISNHKQWPFHSCLFTHDSHIACVGAHCDFEGAIIIIGTGLCGGVLKDDDCLKIGGWGNVISDIGGGAWIGKMIAEKSLRAYDGLEPSSELSKEIMKGFDNDPEKICLWASQANTHELGKLVSKVTEYAKTGDSMGLELIKKSCEEVEKMFNELQKHKPPRVSLVGGVRSLVELRLSASTGDQLSPAKDSPVGGAVLLAMKNTQVS